ncbi:MAG: HepT-like ribonuclease domain-containing protein [Cyanobacteria bacterium P01_D01_bin.116]
MIQAIVAIENRVAGLSFNDFQANETIAKAVFYDFLIIGEAAINIHSF